MWTCTSYGRRDIKVEWPRVIVQRVLHRQTSSSTRVWNRHSRWTRKRTRRWKRGGIYAPLWLREGRRHGWIAAVRVFGLETTHERFRMGARWRVRGVQFERIEAINQIILGRWRRRIRMYLTRPRRHRGWLGFRFLSLRLASNFNWMYESSAHLWFKPFLEKLPGFAFVRH